MTKKSIVRIATAKSIKEKIPEFNDKNEIRYIGETALEKTSKVLNKIVDKMIEKEISTWQLFQSKLYDYEEESLNS